jgi:hypothetical protein
MWVQVVVLVVAATVFGVRLAVRLGRRDSQ